MKTLSYVFLILAVVCLILAFISAKVVNGVIIFPVSYYFSGAGLSLLASIVFALYHVIGLKEK